MICDISPFISWCKILKCMQRIVSSKPDTNLSICMSHDLDAHRSYHHLGSRAICKELLMVFVDIMLTHHNHIENIGWALALYDQFSSSEMKYMIKWDKLLSHLAVTFPVVHHIIYSKGTCKIACLYEKYLCDWIIY